MFMLTPGMFRRAVGCPGSPASTRCGRHSPLGAIRQSGAKVRSKAEHFTMWFGASRVASTVQILHQDGSSPRRWSSGRAIGTQAVETTREAPDFPFPRSRTNMISKKKVTVGAASERFLLPGGFRRHPSPPFACSRQASVCRYGRSRKVDCGDARARIRPREITVADRSRPVAEMQTMAECSPGGGSGAASERSSADGFETATCSPTRRGRDLGELTSLAVEEIDRTSASPNSRPR